MTRTWLIILLVLASPLLLWLLALAGWALLFVFGALYHAAYLLLAFLMLVVFK